MSTKTLNTRIQSKIDTIENWNKSTLPLLAGEIAIATVPATEENGLTDPVCIIRIGEDGVKPFSQLKDALHAKAIDVLPICKDSDKLKEFILNTIDLSTYMKESDFSQAMQLLTVADEATEEISYVSSVTQTNGLITVTKSAFPSFLNDISIVIEPYNNLQSCIIVKNGEGDVISYADASKFIKDGMLNSASYNNDTHILTLAFNDDGGDTIEVPLDGLVSSYTEGDGISIDTDGVVSVEENILDLIETCAKNLISAITTTKDGGLVVTKGTNSYNIDIDESITFIFNCGGAEVPAE